MGNITAVLVLISFFTLVAGFFAGCRLYVRWVLRASRWDDFFLILAMLTSISATVLIMISAVRVFLHFNETPARSPKRISELGNSNEASIAVYTLQNMFARLSFLISYRRFTPRAQRLYQRRTINVLLVIVILVGLGLTYAELFPCYPPRLMKYPYDVTLPKRGYQCVTPRVPFYLSVWYGLAIDFIVYLLPFWTLRDAVISRHHRGVLYTLFAGGAVVLLVSVARVPLVRVYQGHNLTFVSNRLMMAMWILSSAEANGMVIAGSLPTLRPLWRHFMWRLESGKTSNAVEADEEESTTQPLSASGPLQKLERMRDSDETRVEECKDVAAKA